MKKILLAIPLLVLLAACGTAHNPAVTAGAAAASAAASGAPAVPTAVAEALKEARNCASAGGTWDGSTCNYPSASASPSPSGPGPSASSPDPSSSSSPASPADSAPEMTTAEEQAVEAAQEYLALGQGFSYEGLLKQLTSGYGSGFSASDAKFAIRYLAPDWDEQAVEAARNYMQLGAGFSRSSLLHQLTSSYGSGFTEAQAEYAVDKVGL